MPLFHYTVVIRYSTLKSHYMAPSKPGIVLLWMGGWDHLPSWTVCTRCTSISFHSSQNYTKFSQNGYLSLEFYLFGEEEFLSSFVTDRSDLSVKIDSNKPNDNNIVTKCYKCITRYFDTSFIFACFGTYSFWWHHMRSSSYINEND